MLLNENNLKKMFELLGVEGMRQLLAALVEANMTLVDANRLNFLSSLYQAQAEQGEVALERQLVTAKELARIIGYSDQTIWGWARQNRVPYVKVGRSYRFNPDAVIKALEEQTEQPLVKE